MSLKLFNSTTEKWEKVSTMLANSIKVADVESNFEAEDVNGCLKELSDKIKTVKQDVKYIYENGTIGGGTGGGGAAVPIVTVEGEKELVVNSDQIFDIYYSFTSPNPGNGVAYLSYGSTATTVPITQGRNKWTVGPFARGAHTLSIMAEDKQSFWSTPAQIRVISGSLEVETSFSDARDFSLNEELVINFNVLTEVSEDVFLTYILNGAEHTVPAVIGANVLNLGALPFLGVSSFSMWAHNSKYTSNIIKFKLVAADATNLFVSSAFDSATVEIGKNLLIDYRNSMKGQYSFITDYYIDGNKFATVTSFPGVNYWNVGNGMTLGVHVFRIVTKTIDGGYSSEVTVTTEVVSVGYTPYKHVTTGLKAAFEAAGKLNNSTNKNVWEDKSGNNTSCLLHNFNYYSNGWIDGALVLSGRSYAEIDMEPLIQGVKEGFSLDVLFKIKCVGDVDARVLSCKNPLTPFQGIKINTWQGLLTTKSSDIVSTQIQDGTWTKMTFVINRSAKTMIIYVNGVISSVSYLQDNDPTLENYQDEFSYDGKLLLGGGFDETGALAYSAFASIKSLRVYDRALTDEEVLQNHIADIDDEEAQLAVRGLNTTTEGMPTLSFVGNFGLMDENAERIAQISYNDPSDPTKTFIKDSCWVSWQGTSSKNYPVKNYTIKLRNGGLPWLTYAPKDDWKPEDRWTLKANYMDSSGANNIGINKFIHDFFEPYPYPSQIADQSCRANVDGFTVKLMINGEAVGLYTWNIDRQALNNYGFVTYDGDGTTNRNPTAVSYEIAVNSTSGAGAFANDSWDSIKSEFEHRYNYRGEESVVTETILMNGTNTKVLKTGMHNELTSLITWVKNATDDEFFSELDEHFSVRHLIDYYLIAYTLGMVDNLGKNMVLSTWGKDSSDNTIWYPSFYDCDSVMGLNNSGIIAFDAGLDMADGDYNTSNSALWVKLKKMFANDIRERYIQLRMPRVINNTTLPAMLSYENIMSYIGDNVIGKIGQKFYNEDARLKYLIPEAQQWLYMCNGTRREFTERWLKERFVYLDSVYEFNYDQKSIIRSYAQGDLALRLKTYSPQWVLVSFSDAADTKVKKYVGKDYYTEFDMNVVNGTDNNIEIYGSSNVMYIDGINALDVRQINIANAEKLIEIDVCNNNRIEEIELGNNTYLNKVLCSGCTKLGYQVDNRTLDLSSCGTLRELDCSNTHIANVLLNPTGGVIERLDCSNTDITAFHLIGQEYLETLSLNNCKDLDELVVENCNGLKSIAMTDTVLSKIVITGCENLESIDISRTKSLKTLDLRGCPNLKTLIMQGVSNQSITDLDLSYSLNLEYLDISSCGYITNLTFGRTIVEGVQTNFNKLKKLICTNSAIKSLRYGNTAPIPTYIDLAGLPLTDVSFYGCVNVTDIRNINLQAAGSMAPFFNCYNLASITGTVKLKNSASRSFYGCALLTTLPTLDFSEVTDFSEAFSGCKGFTMTHLTKILVNSGITSRFTSQWRMFSGCTAIAGTLSGSVFNLCTGLRTTHEMFAGCTGLSGSLNALLMKPLVALTDASEMFYGCTNICGELPVDFLRYNTELVNTYYMFASTKITYVDLDNLLMYNTKLTECGGMFLNCTKLVMSLSENMFMYNRSLVACNSMFQGCTGLVGSVPRDIFNKIPTTGGTNALRRAAAFIADVKDIAGAIPAYVSDSQKGLFDNCKLLEEVNSFFKGTGVIGKIPADLFVNNNNLTRVDSLFYECTGLTGAIPPNLLKSKPRLSTTSAMFRGCSGLISTIPIGFLDDNPAITNVSEMFMGCSGLYGDIPARISTWQMVPSDIDPEILVNTEVSVQQYGLLDKCSGLTNASYLFSDCVNLSSEIPPTLFMNGSRITSLTSAFSRCHNLHGPIPDELLAECRNLQYANSMFSDCVGVGEYLIDEDNPYAIPEDLFKSCYSLVSVSSMFSMWGTTPHSSYLKGKIPPTLFSNNSKLTNVSYFMPACGSVTGEVPSTLFSACAKLESVSNAFASTSVTAVGSGLFSTCTLLRDMSWAFWNCGSLAGSAPTWWSESSPVKASSYAGCFRGSTGLSNYADIPSLWK